MEYLRVIASGSCNLSCFFCHREGMGCAKQSSSNLDGMCEMIGLLISCGVKKVKFLGGEPTLCKDLPRLIQNIKANHPAVDLSMVSNGTASKDVWDAYVRSGIKRINISLHGFNSEVFKTVTKGSETQLASIKDSIQYLKEKQVLGKVNYVLLRGVNEEEFFSVLDYAIDNGLILDVLNYLGEEDDLLEQYYYSYPEIKALIGSRHRIEHEETCLNRYSLPSTRLYLDHGGTVNLKTTPLNSAHFLKGCATCEKKKYCVEGISAIRLTHEGIIKPCLFRDDNCLDLKAVITNNNGVSAKTILKDYLEGL